MMNGTPKKHSFSSSEEKRGKQMKEEEEKEGGDKSKMEGKDRMGGGGGVCVDMRGEYIILLHSSTVTRCNVTPQRRRVEMHRWQKVNLHCSSPLSTPPLSKSSSQKGHSDHSLDHLIMKMRLVPPV